MFKGIELPFKRGDLVFSQLLLRPYFTHLKECLLEVGVWTGKFGFSMSCPCQVKGAINIKHGMEFIIVALRMFIDRTRVNSLLHHPEVHVVEPHLFVQAKDGAAVRIIL